MGEVPPEMLSEVGSVHTGRSGKLKTGSRVEDTAQAEVQQVGL